MAMRLLLTLLALLTGLAAQLTPAQARNRVEGPTAVGTLAAAARREPAAIDRLVAPVAPASRYGALPRCTVAMALKDADCAPPVMLGIDRARE